MIIRNKRQNSTHGLILSESVVRGERRRSRTSRTSETKERALMVVVRDREAAENPMEWRGRQSGPSVANHIVQSSLLSCRRPCSSALSSIFGPLLWCQTNIGHTNSGIQTWHTLDIAQSTAHSGCISQTLVWSLASDSFSVQWLLFRSRSDNRPSLRLQSPSSTCKKKLCRLPSALAIKPSSYSC